MSEYPENLRYCETHEWARLDADGVVAVGISDHAQRELGDVVFIETPAVGARLETAAAAGSIESVKAASEIYAPLAGEVVAVNEALVDNPGLINESPYEDGWIYKLRPDDAEALQNLLDAAAYRQSSQGGG